MSSTFPARFTGNSLHGGWESDHFPALRSTYAFLHWRHWGSRKRCPLLRILYAICVQGSRAPVRNSQVNRAGRYDATCLLASHNSPSFRLLDNRGEGIRWISTGPLLTWNCYVCNEVIMQRWTTERDLCTLRIFGNRFAGYKRYLGNISVNISEEREILRCFEYREKDNLDIIIFVNRWEEGRNVELLE